MAVESGSSASEDEEVVPPAFIPDVLIEADTRLTEYLWFQSSPRPYVVSLNLWASPLEGRLTPGGNPYASRVPALPLIERLLRGGKDQEPVDRLQEIFADVSTEFAVGDRPLRVAVVGSHTTITGAIIESYLLEGGDPERLRKHQFVNGMRRQRILARLLGAALLKMDGIELVWLADSYPQLRPKPTPGNHRYAEVATAARAHISTLAVERAQDWHVQLPRRAVPLIYVRDSPDGRWKPLPTNRGRSPYSVTDSLIGQFKELRAGQPGLDGVLVKVVPSNSEDYARVDAPVIGAETLRLAFDAGISAILLDRQFGVTRRCDAFLENSTPVFAV